MNINSSKSKPARGGGGREGGKIPGARSAQRGPEISVKCSYCLSSLYVCPKGNTPTCTLSADRRHRVKRTKCEINDFSIVFSAKTVSWTSIVHIAFLQLCGDFLQAIRRQFSRWLRSKIASRRAERNRGPVFTNCHFVQGPVVGSRLLWSKFIENIPIFLNIFVQWLYETSRDGLLEASAYYIRRVCYLWDGKFSEKIKNEASGKCAKCLKITVERKILLKF
jgi:hypothetical protein